MYFEEPERSNTDAMLDFVIPKIQSLNLQHIVIAWSSGHTVNKFLESFKNLDFKLPIAVVTNPKGGEIMGRKVSIPDNIRLDLERQGIQVCYLNDDLHFGEPLAMEGQQQSMRAMLLPFGIPEHLRPLDINAGTDLSLLTIISQGFRVCIGCTVLAVRRGLVTERERTLCLAGRATALVVQASSNAKSCLVKEILAFERNSDWATQMSKPDFKARVSRPK